MTGTYDPHEVAKFFPNRPYEEVEAMVKALIEKSEEFDRQEGPLPVHAPDFLVHAWCLDGTGNRCGAVGGRRTARREAIECPDCHRLATGK